MRPFHPSVMLLILALTCGNVLAADPLERNDYPNAHKDVFRRPSVIDMAFSPDGKHLAAAYFVPARNRPGTDWGAFVAQWDLSTGKRTIIANATAPLAFDIDNRTIVMTMIGGTERQRHPATMSYTLGLWRIGQKKPLTLLAEEAKKSDPAEKDAPQSRGQPQRAQLDQPLGAAFVQERQLVVLSRNGKLVLWRFSDGEKPESKASRLDEVELGWPGGMLSPWNARSTTPFQWDAKAGQISFAYSDLRPARALIRTLTWKLDLENAKAELVSDKTIDPHEKRHLEHIPLRFGPFVMTKDEKRTAETQADGTIKLREMKANEAVTERVLRLDDE